MSRHKFSFHINVPSHTNVDQNWNFSRQFLRFVDLNIVRLTFEFATQLLEGKHLFSTLTSGSIIIY